MEILTVKANNNEIEYLKFGSGDKNFVIIPGLSLKSVMLSADAVASSYDMFSNDYTVYVFGNAKRLHKGYTIDDMADDIALSIKALSIDNAHIFGVSQGGMIAQMIAIKYPELVAKMIIGSSTSRVKGEVLDLINEWVTLADSGDVVALNRSFFEKVYSKELLDSLGNALLELEKDGTPDEMERMAICAGACVGFDIYDELEKIKCKTLVIGAKNDRVLTANASVEMAEKIGCDLYMHDGDHAVYDEAPDYKQRIFDFFKD